MCRVISCKRNVHFYNVFLYIINKQTYPITFFYLFFVKEIQQNIFQYLPSTFYFPKSSSSFGEALWWFQTIYIFLSLWIAHSNRLSHSCPRFLSGKFSGRYLPYLYCMLTRAKRFFA